jgi:hypothetical protein
VTKGPFPSPAQIISRASQKYVNGILTLFSRIPAKQRRRQGATEKLFFRKNPDVTGMTAKTMVARLKTSFHGLSLEDYFTGTVV